jgi:parallel beta-helix repeat protein
VKKLLLTAIALLCCAHAKGEILYVLPGGSIRSAINDANNDDTIIVSAGRYKENINFLGKAITVRSAGPNDANIVAATIIDGNEPADINCSSTVTFNSSEGNDSVLSGFTITGGTGSWAQIYWEYKGYRWNRCGGGILCLNGVSPTISKNIIRANLAGQGGGIYFYNYSHPVILNNTFIDNTAIKYHGFENPEPNDSNNYDHGDGGAIVGFQYCDAVIKGNLIENNYAEWYGGGMHLRQWCDGLIENNHIVGNESALGGGIHLTYTSSPIVRCNKIEKNAAGLFGGGGVYIYNLSDPLVEKNVITENDSVNGSGMAVYYTSAPVIRNNLIFRNKNGAGIRVRGGSNPEILNNTIVGNEPKSYSGGIDCTENAAPKIHNNIIACNGEGYGIYVDSISSPTISNNNVWESGAGNYGPSIVDQTGTNGNISSSPEFLSSDSNDYHLNYNSPCINTGDVNIANLSATDYDGNPRITGSSVDMGAYETWPVWNITSGYKYTRIQQEKTIIDGNGVDTVVFFGSGEDSNCLLTGFTLTGGLASTSYGGGIRVTFTPTTTAGPTIRRNIITGNTAKKGAGICLYNSTARVLDNRIVNNTGTPYSQGAGVMVIDCFGDSNAVIANNIIAGNSATYGGGIRIQNSTAEIANNHIIYNRAEWEGIGVYAEGDTIENCIIWGNINTVGFGSGSAIYQCNAAYSCIDEPNNVAGAGNISEDPCFVDAGYWDDANTPADLDDDFFVVGNYHIPPNSPCVNAGDNNSVPAEVIMDIDSEVRVFSNKVDIGADEVITNPKDLNNDGIVGYYELAVLTDQWLQDVNNSQVDFFEDGFIDFIDYAELASQWKWKGGWYK